MKKQSIPNLLTFARVLAVPVAIGVAGFAPHYFTFMFGLFVVAALTDFLDGYLARKWNAITPLGTMLDPVADKLLVAVMLVYLLKFPIMPVLPVMLLLTRELYIAGLREFLAHRRIALPVSKGGKWKTALQLLAITLLLAGPAFQLLVTVRETQLDPFWNAGMTFLWLSVVLSLASAVAYTRTAVKALR